MVSERTLTLLTSHKEEPPMDFWFTENIVGDGTLLINKTIGIEWDLKRET